MTDPEVKHVLLDMCREKLRLSKLFRWNASLKHGVPIEKEGTDKVVIEHVIKTPQKSVTDSQHTETKTDQTIDTQNKKTSKESSMSIWDKLLAAGLIALLLALGYIIYILSQPQDNRSIPQDRTVQPSSALQWLEDEGEHLP